MIALMKVKEAAWRERSLDELAQEQGAEPYRAPKEAENGAWLDDEEAAGLIEAVRSWD